MKSHILRTSSISKKNKDIEHLLYMGNNSYNRNEKIDFLNKLKEYPWILNTIKYSSEELHRTILKEKEFISDKKLENVIISVYKYLLRLSTRPTPNGYFGLSTLIDLNNTDSKNKLLKLVDKKQHIEISGHIIYDFYNHLIKKILYFKKLKVSVNNILSINNSNYTLPVRGENPKAKEDDYIIYNKNKVIDNIILLCNSDDFLTVDDLSKSLIKEYGFNEQETLIILKELLNSRVLFLKDVYPKQLDIPNFQKMIRYTYNLNPEVIKNTKYYQIYQNIKILTDNFDENLFYKTRKFILKSCKIRNGIFINSESIFNSQDIDLDISNIIKVVELMSEIKGLPSMENLILDEYRKKFIDKYGYYTAININSLFDEINGLGSPYRMRLLPISSLYKKENFEKEFRLKIKRQNKNLYITDEIINELIAEPVLNECCQKSLGLDINYKIYSDDNGKSRIMLQSSPITYAPYSYRGRFQFLNKGTEIINDITKMSYISHNNELWEVQASYQLTKQNISINDDIYVYINNNGKFIIIDKNQNQLSISTMNMSNLNLKSEQVKFLETISSTNHNANYFINLLREIGLEIGSSVYYNDILLNARSKYYNNLEEVTQDDIHFTLEKNDQYIPLNIENMLDKKIIKKEIQKNGGIWLSSPLISKPYNKVVDYYNQELNCEIVSTFTFKREYEDNTLLSIKEKDDKPLFFNGKRGWFYVKLYLNKGVQDYFIINHLPYLITNHKKWFFIRYEDPSPHIRLRIFLEDVKYIEEIFYKLDQLIKTDSIGSYTFDVYRPEYERYGGFENFNLVENIFKWDSYLSMNYIKKFNNDINYIIHNIIYIIERINIPNKNILNILYDPEGMKDKNLRREFDKISTINISKDTDDIEFLKNIVKNINKLVYSINDEESSLSIIDSLLHMHFNRIFGNNRIERNYRVFLYRELKRKEFISRNV